MDSHLILSDLTSLSLKRIATIPQLIYRSAIAYPIAAQSRQPVAEVAALIAEFLAPILHQDRSLIEPWPLNPLPRETAIGLSIFPLASGYIEITVQPIAIAAWLETHLRSSAIAMPMAHPLPLARGDATQQLDRPHHPPLTAQQQFCLQQAHARCVSLLRGCVDTGFLSEGHLEQWFQTGSLPLPRPISWLTLFGQLRMNRPTIYSLMCEVLAIADAPSRPITPQTPHQLFTQAQQLSQQFDQFQRSFQRSLWQQRVSSRDTADTLDPWDEASVVLGLLLLTQRSLRWVLEMGLTIPAPFEL